ncbi:hypothetical protein N9Y92_03750, partial [Chlamydiales bacterium]|nr:hypothetical protein [Chlamydiales bacterium]
SPDRTPDIGDNGEFTVSLKPGFLERINRFFNFTRDRELYRVNKALVDVTNGDIEPLLEGNNRNIFKKNIVRLNEAFKDANQHSFIERTLLKVVNAFNKVFGYIERDFYQFNVFSDEEINGLVTPLAPPLIVEEQESDDEFFDAEEEPFQEPLNVLPRAEFREES